MKLRRSLRASVLALSECPSLILLDVGLGDLAGISVTRRLREQGLTQNVSIVMVSGWDAATHEKLAFAAGCNEYLLKPIDFDRLDAILDRYAPGRSSTNAPTHDKRRPGKNPKPTHQTLVQDRLTKLSRWCHKLFA